MRRIIVPRDKVALAAVVGLIVFVAACHVNVQKSENGEDKKVDVETPVGSIHVNKGVAARDTGLPVYPGAQEKKKGSGHDESNANVNISSSFFGLKVVAIEYLSDDPPEKVAGYYKDQLKKYGAILECHTSNPHGDAGDVDVSVGDDKDKDKARKLTCEHDSGTTLELKVGTKDNQHIVSISPNGKGKGTDFALVFVQTRGGSKDTI
jgi:hypothetical protein